MKAITLALRTIVLLVLVFGQPAVAGVKNVILMVSDGGGYNTWDATSMYQGKWDTATGKSTQVYDGPGWIKYGCSTYLLNPAKTPSGRNDQDPAVVYDVAKAWDRKSKKPYAWLMSTYTDSAAAATAMSSGKKTYSGAINWSDLNQPITPTANEAAKAAGKSVGVITSVEWSHATPASLSNAHNVSRNNFVEIANQMLDGNAMDVIMGAGNPDFDNDGVVATGKKREYKYVGGAETWRAIEKARKQPKGTYHGFRPVSTKAEFEALMSGPTPSRVVGTAQVATTLQQARRKTDTGDPAKDTPFNATVPTLATMTKGALNVLDNNPQGLFLLIEGGAVDWANHKSQAGRMLQEQMDFVCAVQAVAEWVDAHSNWDETLVVLTADHETGLLWGPKSDSVPFDPIVDRGPGRVPEMKYNSKSHTNSLVPLYAKGVGSEQLARFVVGQDPARGPYVDNTGVGQVLIKAATKPRDPVSQP